jgi:hypothetical protein
LRALQAAAGTPMTSTSLLDTASVPYLAGPPGGFWESPYVYHLRRFHPVRIGDVYNGRYLLNRVDRDEKDVHFSERTSYIYIDKRVRLCIVIQGSEREAALF